MPPDFALEKKGHGFNLESGPMRRFVIVFLLLVVQLQFVWGAAASYCGHETAGAVSSKHFGHHDHQHQGESAKALASDGSASNLGTIDADCESCHLGCSSTVPPTAFVIYKLTGDDHRPDHGHRYRSHFPFGLERPDRS